MENQELLQTIAEIAVALVGFSGIVVTLGHRNASKPLDVSRLLIMLRAGFSAMFLSLLPIVLNLFIAPNWLWRVSITVLGLIMLSNVTAALRNNGLANMTTAQRILFVPAVTILLLSFLSAFGFLVPANQMYIVGLMMMLLVSAHNFTVLLVGSLSQNQSPD